ncbi:AbiTii domain-containing protein [Serratia fonticola]
MDNSLVLKLQRESLSQDNKVSFLLTLALFVARKLKLNDVIEVLSPELNGFGADKPVSPFRFLKGVLVAYDGNQEKKITLTSDHLAQYNQVRLPISAIEDLCERNSGEFFYVQLDNEKVERTIQSKIRDEKISVYSKFGFGNTSLEKEIVDALTPDSHIYLKINRISYLNILHCVRSIIQAWSITLEEQGFIGESFTFTKEEKIMAVNNNYNINNLNGILGDVMNSNVTQNNLVSFKNNETLLRESLKDNKVSQDDIDEITGILADSEPPRDKDSFPCQVNEWLKKMMVKSVDGSWGVGIAAAGAILSQIICRYYGIN